MARPETDKELILDASEPTVANINTWKHSGESFTRMTVWIGIYIRTYTWVWYGYVFGDGICLASVCHVCKKVQSTHAGKNQNTRSNLIGECRIFQY